MVRGSLYFRWLSANGKQTTALVHTTKGRGEEENGKDVRNDISKINIKNRKERAGQKKFDIGEAVQIKVKIGRIFLLNSTVCIFNVANLGIEKSMKFVFWSGSEAGTLFYSFLIVLYIRT